MKFFLLPCVFASLLLTGCDVPTPPMNDAKDIVYFVERRPDFMEHRSDIELVDSCNMEALNGKPWIGAQLTVPDKRAIQISGWVFNKKNRSVAESIYIYLKSSDGREFYARANGSDASVNIDGKPQRAAYSALADATLLPKGSYEALVVADVKGHTLMCSNGRMIKL